MLMWHTSPRVPDPHSHWINYVSSLTILILTSWHTYILALVLTQPRLGSVFTPHLNMQNASNARKWPSTASLNPGSLLISHRTMFETAKVWSYQQNSIQNRNTQTVMEYQFRDAFVFYSLNVRSIFGVVKWCLSLPVFNFPFEFNPVTLCFLKVLCFVLTLFPPLNLNRTALTLENYILHLLSSIINRCSRCSL